MGNRVVQTIRLRTYALLPQVNSPMCKTVLPSMRNLLLMLVACLFGCANQLDVSGLGDDDETILDAEQPIGDSGAQGRSSGSVQVGHHFFEEASRADTSSEDLSDSSVDSAGSADVPSPIDTAVDADGVAPGDGCISSDHRCPIGEPLYRTCSAVTTISEQVAHARATSSVDWKWGGPDVVHCSGLVPTPAASGDVCSVMTVTTSAGLFTATWCAEGALAGRFVRSTVAGNVCPYGTDPVAWW